MNTNIVLAAAVAAAIVTVASGARAGFVYHYDLPVVSGAFGAGTATTTDLMGPNHGRLTTVTGPGGGGNRATQAPVANLWQQQNVGGGGSVGITDHFPQSGNGSAYFAGTSGDSKSDLEYYFATPHALSALSSLSYDWYRSSTSTNPAGQHLPLRLIVSDGTVGGYLVYEGAYNGSPTAATDTWTSVTMDLIEESADAATKFWGTGSLPGAFSVFTRTIDDWEALLPSLLVYGISFGAGSGWNGLFEGAVDNVSIAFSDGYALSANFEVPEPAAIGLFGLALLGLWGMRRHDRRAAPPAAA